MSQDKDLQQTYEHHLDKVIKKYAENSGLSTPNLSGTQQNAPQVVTNWNDRYLHEAPLHPDRQIEVTPTDSISDTLLNHGKSAVKGAISVSNLPIMLADNVAEGWNYLYQLVTGTPLSEIDTQSNQTLISDFIGYDGNRAKQIIDESMSDGHKRALAEMQQKVANADGFWDSAYETAKHLVENPLLTTNFIAEEIPQLGAGALLGRGARLASAKYLNTRLSKASASAIGEAGFGATQLADRISSETGNNLTLGQLGIVGGSALVNASIARALTNSASADLFLQGGRGLGRVNPTDLALSAGRKATDIGKEGLQEFAQGGIDETSYQLAMGNDLSNKANEIGSSSALEAMVGLQMATIPTSAQAIANIPNVIQGLVDKYTQVTFEEQVDTSSKKFSPFRAFNTALEEFNTAQDDDTRNQAKQRINESISAVFTRMNELQERIDKETNADKQAEMEQQRRRLYSENITPILTGLQVSGLNDDNDVMSSGYVDNLIRQSEQMGTFKRNNPTRNSLVAVMGDYRKGNTGIGSGDHYDLRTARDSKNGRENPTKYMDRFHVKGKPLSSYNTSRNGKYGMRNGKMHHGLDYGFNESFGTDPNARELHLAPEWVNRVTSVSTHYDKNGGGNYTRVQFDDGIKIHILHQDNDSIGLVKQAQSKQANMKPSQTNQVNTNYSIDGKNIDRNSLMLGTHSALMKAGFTDGQARYLVGEINRENGFKTSTLFGSHYDLKNGYKNLGFISWNKTRRANLINFLKQNGIETDGRSIPQTQQSLDLMAQFLFQEVKSGKWDYGKAKSSSKAFLADANPDRNNPHYGHAMIGWAYGQNSVDGVAFDYKEHENRAKSGTAELNALLGSTPSNVSQDDTQVESRINELLDQMEQEDNAERISELQEQIDALQEQLNKDNSDNQEQDTQTNQEQATSQTDVKTTYDISRRYAQIALDSEQDFDVALNEINRLEVAGIITPEQADSYRQLLDVKTKIQGTTSSEVNNQIINGREGKSALETNLGIRDYQDNLSLALASNDTATINKQMSNLTHFRDNQVDKARALNEVYNSLSDGQEITVAHKNGTWQPVNPDEVANLPNARPIKVSSASRKLIAQITQEAKLLDDFTNAWQGILSGTQTTIPDLSGLATPQQPIVNATPTPNAQVDDSKVIKANKPSEIDENTLWLDRVGKQSMPLDSKDITNAQGMFGNPFNTNAPDGSPYKAKDKQDKQDKYNNLLASHYVNSDVMADMIEASRNQTWASGIGKNATEAKGLQTILNDIQDLSRDEARQKLQQKYGLSTSNTPPTPSAPADEAPSLPVSSSEPDNSTTSNEPQTTSTNTDESVFDKSSGKWIHPIMSKGKKEIKRKPIDKENTDVLKGSHKLNNISEELSFNNNTEKLIVQAISKVNPDMSISFDGTKADIMLDDYTSPIAQVIEQGIKDIANILDKPLEKGTPKEVVQLLNHFKEVKSILYGFKPTNKHQKEIKYNLLNSNYADFMKLALTDDKARALLKEIPSGYTNAKSSLFDRLVNGMLKFLGLPRKEEITNLFEQVIDNLGLAVEAQTSINRTTVTAVAKSNKQRQAERAKAWNEQNLITSSFTQKTKSNLTKYPDIINRLVSFGTDELKRLGFDKPSNEQLDALEHFLDFREQFSNHLLSAYAEKNPKFMYEDMKGFLNIGTKDNPEFDESVITALALSAYDYILANGGSKINRDKYIATAFLGMDKETNIPYGVSNMFKDIGLSLNQVRADIGSQAVNILGLSSMNDTPSELQARLVTSLGDWVIDAMGIAGMGERIYTPKKDVEIAKNIVQGFENAIPDDLHGDIVTFKFYNEKDDWYINTMLDVNSGTAGFVANIFGVESAVRYPTTIPPKPTQHKIEKTQANVSKTQNDAINTVEQEAMVLNKDMYTVMSNLQNQDNEFLEKIVGASIPTEESLAKQGVHITRRKGLIDKATQTKKDLDNYFAWAKALGNPNTPFFDRIKAVVNTRMHLMSTVFNFQGSTVHRALGEFKAFENEIDISQIGKVWVDDKGNPLPHTLLLRAIFENAEGTESIFENALENKDLPTGFTQDKLHTDNFADIAWNYLTTDTDVQNAVKAMTNLMNGKQLSDKEKSDIETIVSKWKMGTQSLRALMETTNLLNAFHNKENSIITSIGLGSDGINNGTAIGMVLMGIKDKLTLNRVGLFHKDDEYNNYQDARNDSGIGDYYLGLSPILLNKLSEAESDKVVSAIVTLTPSIKKRKVLKDMLIPFGYSASSGRITQVVFERMMSDITDKMEELVKEKDKQGVEDLEKELQKFLGNKFTLPKSDELLNFTFTDKDYKNLKAKFSQAMYSIVDESINEYAPDMVARRSANINMHNHISNIYIKLYTELLARAVQNKADKLKADNPNLPEKELSKLIAFNTLTPDEIKEQVTDVLKDVFPVTHTAHSNRENDTSSIEYVESVNGFKSDSLTETIGYRFDEETNSLKKRYSKDTVIVVRNLIDSGLRPNSQMIQNIDAFVTSLAMVAGGKVSINVHDADIASLLHYITMSQAQNEAFFEGTASYHMFLQTYTTFTNMIENAYKVFDKEYVDGLTENLKDSLITGLKTHIRYDLEKIELLREYIHIHQYGGDGGRVTLTQDHLDKLDKYEQEIISKRDKLISTLENLGFSEDIPANYPMLEAVNITNHTGGANGADSSWDIIGREYGVDNHIHYRPNGIPQVSRELNAKGVTGTILTDSDLNEAKEYYTANNITSGKGLTNKLILRNYFQVKNADSVFAVAPLSKGNKGVTGGTNTAVKLGIHMNKPVFVWDTSTQKWYKYSQSQSKFIQIDYTPRLTPNFAGVGTRDISAETKDSRSRSNEQYLGDEVRDRAIQAIRDVYENSVAKLNHNPNTLSGQDVPIHEDIAINVWYGNNEYSELSNLAYRPFVIDDDRYESVEHYYQTWKTGKFNVDIYDKDWKAGSHYGKGTPTTLPSKDRLVLMKRAIKASFEQNTKARNILLSTRDMLITHKQDKGFWGKYFPQLLMEVRSELQNSQLDTDTTFYPEVQLNESQQKAVDEIMDFVKDPNRTTHSLIGNAGSGKTTSLKSVLNRIRQADPNKRILMSTPTHRANSVIKRNMPREEITTIASLIGRQAQGTSFSLIGFNRMPASAILVIDESSMLDEVDFKLLISSAKIAKTKILFVGDDAQLPPVATGGGDKMSPALTSTEKVSKLDKVMRAKNNELLNESTHIRGTQEGIHQVEQFFTGETNINEQGTGVAFTDDKDTWLSKAISLFNSQEFKDNPLLTRIVAPSNYWVKAHNDSVRKALFGDTTFAEGMVLMGYTTRSRGIENPDEEGRMPLISNSADYKIISAKQGIKRLDNGVEVKGHYLTLLDLIAESDSEVFVVDDTELQSNTELRDIYIRLNNLDYQISKATSNTTKQDLAFVYNQTKRLLDNLIVKVDIKKPNPRNPSQEITIYEKDIDYGYAHTIHKSQGGTYNSIFVQDVVKGFTPNTRNRLRYVGISRAEDTAYILSSRSKPVTGIQKERADRLWSTEVTPTQTNTNQSAINPTLDELKQLISSKDIDSLEKIYIPATLTSYTKADTLDVGVQKILSMVDMSKVPQDEQDLFNAMLEQVKQINPTVRIDIHEGIETANMGNYSDYGNLIEFYPKVVIEGKTTREPSSVILGAITHELGHAITSQNLNNSAFEREATILKKASKQLEQAIKAHGNSLSRADLAMLKYATKNEHEFLVVSMTDNKAVRNFIQKYVDFTKIDEAKDYPINTSKPIGILLRILHKLLGLNSKSFKIYQSVVSNVINSETHTQGNTEKSSEYLNSLYIRLRVEEELAKRNADNLSTQTPSDTDLTSIKVNDDVTHSVPTELIGKNVNVKDYLEQLKQISSSIASNQHRDYLIGLLDWAVKNNPDDVKVMVDKFAKDYVVKETGNPFGEVSGKTIDNQIYINLNTPSKDLDLIETMTHEYIHASTNKVIENVTEVLIQLQNQIKEATKDLDNPPRFLAYMLNENPNKDVGIREMFTIGLTNEPVTQILKEIDINGQSAYDVLNNYFVQAVNAQGDPNASHRRQSRDNGTSSSDDGRREPTSQETSSGTLERPRVRQENETESQRTTQQSISGRVQGKRYSLLGLTTAVERLVLHDSYRDKIDGLLVDVNNLNPVVAFVMSDNSHAHYDSYENEIVVNKAEFTQLSDHEKADVLIPLLEQAVVYNVSLTPKNFLEVIQESTSEELFKSLDSSSISDEHNTHLNGLIDNVIGFYNQAQEQGIKPKNTLSNTSLITGLGLSDKEAFITEALYEVFKVYISNHAGTMAVNGIDKLYGRVRAEYDSVGKLFPNYANETKENKEILKKIYQSAFNPKSSKESLAWFMALASSSEVLSQALGKVNVVKTNSKHSWFDKIMGFVEGILNYLNTGSLQLKNKSVKAQLDTYVSAIARVETKARKHQADIFQNTYERVHQGLGKLADKPTRKAIKLATKTVADSSILPKSLRSPFSALYAVLNNTDVNLRTGESIADGTLAGIDGTYGLFRESLNEVMGVGKRGILVDRLARVTNRVHQSRQRVQDNTIKSLKEAFTTELSTKQKEAITKTVLRTELASLLNHGFKARDVIKLLNKSERTKLIKDYEHQLLQHFPDEKQFNTMLHQTYKLGFYMATGKAKPKLVKSAEGIAIGLGTQWQTDISNINPDVFKLVDVLSSLLALEFSSDIDLKAIEKLSKTEAKGLEATLNLANDLVKKSKADFEFNALNYSKGYTVQLTNPRRKIVFASPDEIDKFKSFGFEIIADLAQDSADNTEPRVLMLHSDYTSGKYVSGALDMYDTHASGTPIYEQGIEDTQIAETVKLHNQDLDSDSLTRPTVDSFDTEFDNALIATYGLDGSILNFHYEMEHSTRDIHLERDNDFDTLLGTLNGKLHFKPEMQAHQRAIAKEIVADVKANYKTRPSEYIMLDFNSTDYEVQRMIAMIPHSFRQALKDGYGREMKSYPVHKSIFVATFGYQAYSLVSIWDKVENDVKLNIAESFILHAVNMFGKEKARSRVLKIEELVQDLMTLIKDMIVVRSGGVLLGNILSNTYMLMAQGINPYKILKDTVFAWRNGKNYTNQINKLEELKAKKTQTKDKQLIGKYNAQIQQLTQSLQRNPLHKYMQAGLMSTIVEDVSLNKETKYKSRLDTLVDDYTTFIPKPIKTAFNEVTMGQDSILHGLLSEATQFSDFSAKFVLANHLQSKGSSFDKAVYEAQLNFINYDIPTNKALDYLNRIGLTMFTKFFLRFQRAMAKVFYKAPVTALTQHMAVDYMGGQGIFEPFFLNRLGSPIDGSVFLLPDAMTDTITAQMIQSMF